MTAAGGGGGDLRQQWCTSLIPAFQRQRKADLCEYKAGLDDTGTTQKGSDYLVFTPCGKNFTVNTKKLAEGLQRRLSG